MYQTDVDAIRLRIYLSCTYSRNESFSGDKSQLQKQMREMEYKLTEAQEDLDAERNSKSKLEKEKRDLREVSCDSYSSFVVRVIGESILLQSKKNNFFYESMSLRKV